MPRRMFPLPLLFSAIVAMNSPDAACAEPPVPPARVKIGVLMPFSGEAAPLAEKARKGFELAQSRFAEGAEVIYEDIGSYGSAQAVRAAGKLLDLDKVVALVGPVGLEQTIPVAALAERKGVPVFAFSLCSDSFKRFSNVFCGYPNTHAQLQTMLPWLKARNVKKLSAVCEDSEFGNETCAILKEMAGSGSFEVVYDTIVPAADSDLRSVVTRVKRSAADGIFTAFVNPAHALRFLKQLQEAGFRGERFAYIDYDDKYLEDFGELLEGVIIPGAFGDEFGASFSKLFTERYNQAPELYGAEAYDLLGSVLLTLKQNNWDASQLAVKIPEQTFPEAAITGFRYTREHNVSFPLATRVVRKKSFVLEMP